MQTNPGIPKRFDPVTDPRPDDRPWPTMVWPIAPGTELLGRSVRVSAIRPIEDAAELFAILDYDRVWEHIAGRPDSVGRYETFLSELDSRQDRQQWIVRTTVDRPGITVGEMVGTSSYLEVSPHDARLEIGFTKYTPSVWGSDVNPDVKLTLLTYAFEILGVGRVQLKTDVRNVRSQQAIARIGARYEGTLGRYQRRSDGSVRDSALFSITAEDWPGIRLGLGSRLDALAP